MLNKNQNQVIPVEESEDPALSISISSSDNEYSDDLAHAPPQLVREVEIVHSLREPNDSDASLGETNMVKFKNLHQKDASLDANPPALVAPLVS